MRPVLSECRNLNELARAYREDLPLGSHPVTADFARAILLAPAAVARWIELFRPELRELACLHIVIPLQGARSVAALDSGRWYQVLPALLDRIDLRVSISFVGRGAAELEAAGDAVMSESAGAMEHLPRAELHGVPFADYLQGADRTPPDLVFMFDPDSCASSDSSLVEDEGLAAILKAGIPIGAASRGVDDFVLSEGVLSLSGFCATSAREQNSYFFGHSKKEAGGAQPTGHACLLWEFSPERVEFTKTARATLLHEWKLLQRYLTETDDPRAAFPDVSRLGLETVEHKVQGFLGEPLVVLPHELYFHRDRQRFLLNAPEGVWTPREFERYAARSVMPLTFEGRTDRFTRMLWAVHVASDCEALYAYKPPPSQRSDDGVSLMTHESEAEDREDTRDEEAEADNAHSLGDMLSSTLEGLARAMQSDDPAPPQDHETLLSRVPLSELFKELLERNKLRAAVALAEDEAECLFVADDDGWTLLHHLLSDGEFDCAQGILRRGASARALTQAGQSAFHLLAGTHGDEQEAGKLIGVLYAAGAKLNEADENGTLPLEDAADSGNWTVFQGLLDMGADIRKTRLAEEALLEEPGVRASAGLRARIIAAFHVQPA